MANHGKSLDAARLEQLSAEQLEAEIRHHNHLYWDLAAPEIADYDYDRLVERLRQLRPDSPVLDEMGPADVGQLGEEVVHERPMLSLDKCYTGEDLEAWAAKFDGEVMVTPKLDGIACSLRYDGSGRLTLAATRGDGRAGDNITRNARTIGEIVTRLPGAGPCEVRGEIYMRLSVFRSFSEQFSNPRNLTAGAIKHKDPRRCREYRLSFSAYDLLGVEVASEQDKLQRLEALGFPALEHRLVGKDELRAGYEHFASARSSLDFEIDGVVFKANRRDEQQRLGATAHHPRYAIAYKFQGDSATTVLEEVLWSVARSGVITPVARIRPVTLSGAEVSRASLHNAGYLDKMGLLGRPTGASVVVTRRGGVIPKVEFVAKPAAEGDPDAGEIIAYPEVCPSCGGPVVRQGDFLSCARPGACRDAIIGTIAHYCAVVDIQGFGDKLLGQCYERGLLRGVPDLYRLTVERLLPLERVGEKLARNLVQQVDAHRQIPLATFLRALGIEEIGPHVAGILEQRCGELDAVRRVTREELAAIHTVGEIIADKVVRGLRNSAPLIDALLEHVTVLGRDDAGEVQGDGPLAGKSFVFTGKLLALERRAAQQRVRELGGEAPGGVTRDLTFLVVGDGAARRKSSKQVKADKYIADGAAIEVISESDFLAMVGDG